MIRLLLPIYQLAWTIAMPWLRRSPRLAIGWRQRVLAEWPEGPFDLWIQAASGGEAQLTNMILADLAATLPPERSIRVLATSGTSQGLETLAKGITQRGQQSPVTTTVAAFPFDAPNLMEKAFTLFSPKLCVTVETELWPGFLWQARRRNIPTMIVNGRMSPKSFRSYRHLRWLFGPIAPSVVLAISPEDGQRFTTVFESGRVRLMHNMKFDRISPAASGQLPPFARLLPANAPFVLLGSIRKEEEEDILATISTLLERRRDIFIGLFPKHIERANHWLQLLASRKIAAVLRSQATTTQLPGGVMVWDVFGELAGAYQLARTTFIGGSLRNLGGQNFLEPLVFGLRPIIGPYWWNFAWVSRRIVEDGLVLEVAGQRELCATLLSQLDSPQARDQVMNRVQHFLSSRIGGTRAVSSEILNKLKL